MSSIMMDRWSIESIYHHCCDEDSSYRYMDLRALTFMDWHEMSSAVFERQCWDNFLTAIVLWDEILSFNQYKGNDHKEHPLSPFWEDSGFHPTGDIFDKIDRLVHNIERSEIDESYNIIYETLAYKGDRYADNRYADLTKRALLYQLISNSLGIPYFAHPSRKEYLFIDETLEHFTRLDLIDKVDGELMEYYNRINEELGRNMLGFKFPVLLDYIRKDTQTVEEEIDRALELRMNDDVVIFRKQLFDIEQSIMRGDTQLLLSELKMVSDLAKEITNKYQKRTNLGEFTIALSPSLTIPLSLGKNKKRALHATFIRRLIDFGVYERG